MGSTGASVSLNCVCTTAAASDSANVVPHYLRSSTGSCHDICKYGRRRAPEEQLTKPLHKTAPKLSIVVPSHRKKEAVNSQSSPWPSSDAKSFSPKAKNHSPRRNASSDATQVVKRGIALSDKAQVQVQVKESRNSDGGKMPKQKKGCQSKKPVMVKPSSPRDSSDGVHGKRRRNEDVQSGGRKTATVEFVSPPKDQKRVKRVKTDSSNNMGIQRNSDSVHGKRRTNEDVQSGGGETATVDLVSPRKDQKRVKTDSSNNMGIQSTPFQDEDEIPRIKAESNEFELMFEAVADAPSSSSHGEDGEESDKLASDTTVSPRKRKRHKRRRKNRVVKSGDEHNQPVKLKFRTGKTMHPHEENNAPRWHKFRAISMDKIRADDSMSDNNKSRWIGPPKGARGKDKNRSSRNRHRRIRYGKTRILVLEDRKGGSKRKYEDEEDDAAVASSVLLRKSNLNHQDVQCLFNNVIEETASKLAERRKGMVKSLVGVFETLISLQAHKCILQLRKMNV